MTVPNQSFCDLQSPTIGNLVAANNGGGVAWFATTTTTTPLAASTGLVNGAVYYTDNTAGNCGTRQPVTVTIYGPPTGLNFQGVCVDDAGSATISDLIATGNNVQWFSVPNGGTPLPVTTVLMDNTIYYASQSNPDTGCQSSRLSVFVNVGVVPVPTGPTTQQFCLSPGVTPTVANLQASGNNNWYLTSTSGAALDAATPLVNGQSYFATTVDPPCESLTRFEVQVSLLNTVNAGTNGSRRFCASDVPTTAPFNLFSSLNNSPNPGGTWSGPLPTANGHLGTVNISTLTAAGSPYVFTYTVNNGVCPAASATVTLEILPMPTATISANSTICSGGNATVTFTGTPNATVTYTTSTGGTQNITLNASGTATISTIYTATTTYNLVSVSSGSSPTCVQPLTGSVTITVTPLPNATIAANTTVCMGGSATVTFTGTPNATVTYTTNPGGTQSITLNASGTATITNIYNVTTTFTLVSIASAGTPSCVRPLTSAITITVTPIPTVTLTSSTTVCSGNSATITFSGTPNAIVTYTANPGGTQTITLNAAGTAILTNVYTTTTTFTLVSIATAGTPSCTAPASGSITVTVLPPPTASIAANTTVCSGQSATVTFTGTPNATVTFTANPGGAQTITLNASGTATISAVYTTTTTYTLTSISSGGTPSCTRPLTGTITITVTPPPTVTISSNATVCPNTTATVTFTGTPNAIVTYTANPGGTQTITLNAAGTATLVNTYAVTTIYTLVSVATAGTPGCTAPASGTISITVTPPPTVTIASSTTVCSGQSATVTFTGTPNAVVTYTINPGGTQNITLNASGTATITNTYTATTTFTLVGVNSGGTPSCPGTVSGSVTVTVAPLPTATFAANATVCAGQPATITFTGTPNATVTYTANPGGTQTVTLNASGTASVTNNFTTTTVFTLVSVATAGTPACPRPLSGTVTITVLPPPTVAITASQTILCSGGTAIITFTGTPNATVNYTVTPGGAQSITLSPSGTATISTTYTATTTYTLVNITSGGTPSCTQPVTGSVTLTVAPLPVAAMSADATVCPNGPATINFTGTPNATISFTATPGGAQTITLDASGAASFTANYAVTTIYTLSSVTSLGPPSCTQPLTGTVTITVAPPPTATISTDATICPGQAATINFTGTPNAIVTYTATPGGTQTVTLNAAGTASVTNNYSLTTVITLVSASSAGSPGCTQPLNGSVTITVLPLPVVSIASSATICLNSQATVTFTGTPNAVVTYTANPGGTQTIALNASGTATIVSTYTTTTTYTLVSITASGTTPCTAPVTGSVTITVLPLPVATISMGGSICAGSTASVTISGTPNAQVTYTTNPGGTQTVTLNAAGIAVISGTYSTTTVITLTNVSVSGTPTCSQPLNAMTTIAVTPPPVAGNNAAFSICATGSSQNLFLLLGSAAQPGGTWSPALSGGNGIFNPAVDASGTYTYTLAGSPPCLNAVASVTVTVVPPANAGADGTASLCSNQNPLDLTTYLTGAQAGGVWSPALASGTNIFNPGLDSAGVYTYTVIGTAPCAGDSATVTVTIAPGPDAGISGSVIFCQDSAATDLFLSLGGTPQIGGTWSPVLASGTGVFDPAVDAAGIYTYTFSGNQPCDDDTATVTVTVNPLPDAGQDGTAFFCTNYTPADLFDNLGGTPQAGGSWSPALVSGTGVFNPLLDAPGVYTYTVGGGLCATDTATITVSVTQSPNAGGNGATLLLNACDTQTAVNLFDGLNGMQGTGTWADDDASGALTANLFNAAQAGAGTYHFTYTVSGGVSPCLTDTATVTVIVNPVPNAGLFTGIQSLCNSVGTLNLFGLLTGYQAGGDWVDAANLVVNNNLDISAFVPGTYSYSYVITNPCGTDSETVQFTIVPNPVLGVNNIVITTPVCLGAAAMVNLTGLPDGAYLLTYNLSGSNTVGDLSISLTVTAGLGTFVVPASDLVNTGITTITFLNIADAAANCVTALTDVALDFSVNPLPQLQSTNVSVNNLCLGTNALVSISGATLTDGIYQFDYNVPGGNPASGTAANVSIMAGAGQFNIPGSVLASAGNYSLNITAIVSAANCGNSAVTASASFTVYPVPNAGGAIVSTNAVACGNDSQTITITGAVNLPDAVYVIDYDLSGANVSSQQTTLTFTAGAATFDVPSAQISNAGTTTLAISQLALQSTTCGISGVTFNAVSFTVNQLGTPVLVTDGEQFCSTLNPTIADLSANISGSETIIWYDADTGGTAYNESDLLVNGNTYYAAYTASGCESATRLEVVVDLTQCVVDEILIPDGFSPNGDGINDDFTIRNLRGLYPNFRLEIYNRYGNILYKGNNATPDWDGTSQEAGLKMGGNVVPVGVYFYILEFNDGQRKPVQGRLYLSR